MNISRILEAVISDQWTETDPALADVVTRFDEFDPMSPALQILFETLPERAVWLIKNSYRIEQVCKITVHMKLVRYNPDVVLTSTETWDNLKAEISRILYANKFTLPTLTITDNTDLPAPIINLDVRNSWNEGNTRAVGRGEKTTAEPIVWKATLFVTAISYSNADVEFLSSTILETPDGNHIYTVTIANDGTLSGTEIS